MIVHAVGLTSEPVAPAARQRRASTADVAWPKPVDWLVLSADRATRDRVLAAIRRDGRSGHVGFARAAARSMIGATRYRCAFIDLLHPVGGRDGLAAWLRALRLERTRLVVRGRDDDIDDELAAREAGAAAFLPGEVDGRGLDRLLAEISS
jgi:hypothetical protein